MPCLLSHSAVVSTLARLRQIDDAGIAVVAGEEALQLGPGVVALDDRVADIGPVEAGGEDARFAEAEALDDVVAGGRIGGGGERDARHAGIVGGERWRARDTRGGNRGPTGETQCASSMAMRAIWTPCIIDLKPGSTRRSGGDIEQVERAGLEVAEGFGGLFGADRGVERRGVDPGLAAGLRPGRASAR